MGFEESKARVTIVAGKTLEHNFVLKTSTKELSAVKVTGIVEGQRKALNQQRNADNIKQVVSLDLMGRFPDLNVAESLQRLPGVTIGRERGEGADVQLRGTPASYTNININGEQIMGTQPEGYRNAQLDVIPVDVLASMEVVKTLTPDLDGDAIAGVVNMKTPTAVRLKPSMSVNVGSGYNNLRSNLNTIANLSYGKRFFPTSDISNGRLGVIVNGSYFRTKNGRDRIEAQKWRTKDVGGDAGEVMFPTDIRYRYLESVRVREGLSSTIDYKFSPNTSLLGNFMYNDRDDDDTRYRRRFRMDNPELEDDGSFYDSKGRTYNQVMKRTQEVRNFDYDLQGKTRINNLSLDAALFYTDSRRNYYSGAANFNSGKYPLSISSITTTYLAPEGDHGNASRYTFDTFEKDDEITEGNNLVARLNMSLPYDLGKASGMFKAGVKSKQLNNKRYHPGSYIYSDFTGTDDEGSLTSFVGKEETSDKFMDNHLNFGFSVDPRALTYYYDNATTKFSEEDDVTRMTIDNYYYDAEEDVLAGYVMTKLQFEKTMLLLGVRVERTKVDYKANIVNQTSDNEWISTDPVSAKNHYVKVLPNLQLKYDLPKNSQIRGALTFGYSRPNFGDLVPARALDTDDEEITIGNPDLQPAFSTNLDLMYEKFLKHLGIISAGAFYKNIDKFQYLNESQITGDEFDGASDYEGWYLYQKLNGNAADVYGLELNLQMNLTFLPGILKGLSFAGNYTYTSSSADTQDRSGLKLPGQASNAANASLSFAFKGFTIQGNVNYNGSYVMSLGASKDEDVIRDSRVQLDMNTSYRINKRFTVYMEMLNLTNAPQSDYYGNKSHVYQQEYYSWWSRLGLKYQF